MEETHRFRTHRVGSLLRDDARIFFAAHRARLLNLLKARGTTEEKEVIAVRRKKMLAAERLYGGLRREALGIAGHEQERQAQPRPHG